MPESPEWLQMTSPHITVESNSSNEKEALLSANNSNENGNNKIVDKTALQHMNPVKNTIFADIKYYDADSERIKILQTIIINLLNWNR